MFIFSCCFLFPLSDPRLLPLLINLSLIFTDYVNVPLSIGKLDDNNYNMWDSNIKFYLKIQDYVGHLIERIIDEKRSPLLDQS